MGPSPEYMCASAKHSTSDYFFFFFVVVRVQGSRREYMWNSKNFVRNKRGTSPSATSTGCTSTVANHTTTSSETSSGFQPCFWLTIAAPTPPFFERGRATHRCAKRPPTLTPTIDRMPFPFIDPLRNIEKQEYRVGCEGPGLVSTPLRCPGRTTISLWSL